MSTPFSSDLLVWYDTHARVLPWRMPPKRSKAGERPDPYHVWLSEIMLQQTQVATVRDYYAKFLRNWPTVFDLAKASDDAVMSAWAGLGYYSRARNLKKCASILTDKHKGQFPQTFEDLRQLPGIGDYTAGAIAAIAFGKPAVVVDGNVERVIARQFTIETPLPAAKSQVREKVQHLLPRDRPGDFAQAIMDVGATLCSPRKPACALCPINTHCKAFESGEMERYPIKAPKREKPTRRGAALVITNKTRELFLIRRPERGLLGGMAALPSTDWTVSQDGATGQAALPFKANWKLAGTIGHTFTHFYLVLEVWQALNEQFDGFEGKWVSVDKLADQALPTVFKKAIAKALPDVF